MKQTTLEFLLGIEERLLPTQGNIASSNCGVALKDSLEGFRFIDGIENRLTITHVTTP